MTDYRDLPFHRAIVLFLQDMRAEGRINSKNTERAYGRILALHGDDLGNRHPAEATRTDVKTTLRRWNGNSQGHSHAILSSFYRWCMEEGIRPDNPAWQVRKPKKRAVAVYRMTEAETLRLLREAKHDQRDNWTARLGVCAGLRAQELIMLQGRHLKRKGWVWISEGIGKGMKERWIPVMHDLEDVAEEIRQEVGDLERVLAPRKWLNGDRVAGGTVGFHRDRELSYPGLHKAVVQLGVRAGVSGRVTPHTLRHAFGDYVAKRAGLRVAQALMGHADIKTTVGYTETPTLDELASSVKDIDLGMTRDG